MATRKDAGPAAKGDGWLMKRGKWWIACWKYNGKLHKKTTKETSEAKARAKLAEFVAPYKFKRTDKEMDVVKAALGKYEEQREALDKQLPALKVEDAFSVFSRLEASERLAASTMLNRKRSLAALALWLDERREDGRPTEMREVTATDAGEYLDSLKMRGVTLQSCGALVSIFKATWEAIATAEARRVRDGKGLEDFAGLPLARLNFNPWTEKQEEYLSKAIRAKGAVRQKREAFTKGEMQRIFATAKGELLTLFQIGALTGLRLGDAACLKWGVNVKLDEGETGRLYIIPKKTERSSGAVVSHALGAELRGILAALDGEKRSGDFVLPACAADYLKEPVNLSHKVQRVIKTAGIESQAEVAGCARKRTLKGFHSLRYSFVSIRANNGEDLDDIRADVGHSSTKMTEQYHQKDEAALEREAAIVSDFFRSSPKRQKRVQKREMVAAGEIGRAEVADAQKPVFDAVCSMLGNLEPQTLRAVASEALKLAMENAAKGVKGEAVAAS